MSSRNAAALNADVQILAGVLSPQKRAHNDDDNDDDEDTTKTPAVRDPPTERERPRERESHGAPTERERDPRTQRERDPPKERETHPQRERDRSKGSTAIDVLCRQRRVMCCCAGRED